VSSKQEKAKQQQPNKNEQSSMRASVLLVVCVLLTAVTKKLSKYNKVRVNICDHKKERRKGRKEKSGSL